MPQMDGLQCLAKIRKDFPDVKVAMLSVSQDPELIQTALKRGANAYIVKTVDPQDLPGALRQAMEGNVFTTVGVSGDPGEQAAKEAGLTDRELVIVRAVARGLSNEAIAKELWVAEQTVKFHLTNIYRKLEVSNRTEAARYAFEQGLVEHD
jgi:DNA-binding NarL/FixJ family response regulator